MARSLVTFSRSVDQFMVYAQVRLRLRPSTLRSYRWVLERTVDVVGADTDPKSITEEDLGVVLAVWSGCSRTTISGRISVWHTYFKWLSKQEPKSFDPSRDIERPGKDKPVKRGVSPAEFAALVAAAVTLEERLVVLVLGMTGVRRSEFRQLRWRDFDLTERILTVHDGKGGKGRYTPLRRELVEFLEGVAYDADDYLVDPKWNESYTYKLIDRLARRSGVARPVGNHALRRMFARTYLHANPGEIYSLKLIMGHESIDTTHGYTGDADLQLARAGVDRMGDPDRAPRRDPLVEDLVVELTGTEVER